MTKNCILSYTKNHMDMNYDDFKNKVNSLDDSRKKQMEDLMQRQDIPNQYKDYWKQYQSEQQPQQQEQSQNQTFNSFWTNQQQQTQEQPQQQKFETPTYDPEEKLDTSMFKESDGKISVKEGTAKETWQPDFVLNSDARMNEITNNLNAHWKNNPEYFRDRDTYNQIFHYSERSDQQKALLDSYWKKKEDTQTAQRYNTWDSILNGMNDAEITNDQLNYIKEYSPEAYREWQQKQQDEINLRIANLATPADPTANADLFNSLSKKLNLDPWESYKIYDNWTAMCEKLWVFRDSEKLQGYQQQLNQNHQKMEQIMNRYANSAWWNVSDALAAARMQKALAPYQQVESNLQNAYTVLLNGRNSNLAIANQSAQVMQAQAQEDQRIFNQRLQGLGFAMQTANYRTPEQQAQLQLTTQAISNEMNLLQQSRQQDLNLYNQYAGAKLQNQLQNELTDLSVSDPKQLRANLNNALTSYYEQYGDIIQRSQAQVVDDIINYANEHWISVAQAMTENFIKPLQWKAEYKQKVANDYGMLSRQSIATINWKQVILTTNPNGSIAYNYITDPNETSTYVKPYDLVDSSHLSLETWTWTYTLGDFLEEKESTDWYKAWQCAKYVNDYLEKIWLGRYFWNEDIKTREWRINLDANTPKEWTIAIFDYGVITKETWKNHGHVGIVTKVYKDWSFDVKDSNYDTKNPETVMTRHIPAWSPSCKGFFDPSQPPSVKSTSNLSSVDEAKKQNYLEEARRGQMTNTDIVKIWDLAAEQWRWDERQKALKKGRETNLTDDQLSRVDKTDSVFSSNAIVKEFESAVNQIEQLQAALNDNSGVGDMSAIFTFMKTLDPSSVVRETEFDSAAKTAWVLNADSILQSLEKNVNGKFLTEQQREDFKKIAKEFIKVKANNYNVKYNDLLKRYDQFWIPHNFAPTNMANVVMEALDGGASWPSTQEEQIKDIYSSMSNTKWWNNITITIPYNVISSWYTVENFSNDLSFIKG